MAELNTECCAPTAKQICCEPEEKSVLLRRTACPRLRLCRRRRAVDGRNPRFGNRHPRDGAREIRPGR